MESKDQIAQDQNSGLSRISWNFSAGALLGLVPLLLSVAYYVFLGDHLDWNTLGAKSLVVLPFICGVLSAAFGKRFVSVLGHFLSYLG